MANASWSSQNLPKWAKILLLIIFVVYLSIAVFSLYIGGLERVADFLVFGAMFFAYLAYASDGMGLFSRQFRDIPIFLTRMIFRLAMVAIVLWCGIYMLQ